MLPRSVELVVGDVGDPSTLKTAVEGCNKIIYCATARSAITGDLNRVDNRGVYNCAKAFQVLLHHMFFCAEVLLSEVYLLIVVKLYMCVKRLEHYWGGKGFVFPLAALSKRWVLRPF